MWYSAVGCIVTLTLSLPVLPLVAQAQALAKVPRLGWLASGAPPCQDAADLHLPGGMRQFCADPGVLRDPTDPLSEPGCRRKHGQKHQKEKHVQAESPTDDGKWTRFPDTSKAHLPYIPSTCYPSICYPKFLHNGDPLQQRFDRQGPLLDEHQRRLWAAAAVQTLERGCARAFTSS